MSKKLIKVKAKELALSNVSTPATKPNIMIGTLNVFADPVKSRYRRFYHPENNSWWWWNLGADLILLILVIGLAVFNIMAFTGKTNSPSFSSIGTPTINQPNLNISIRKDREIIKPGDKPIYTITYQNTSKTPINDLLFAIDLEGLAVGGKKQVILSSAEYPELKTVNPGVKGEIKKTIDLNKNIENPTNTNLILTATVGANFKNPAGQEFNSNGNKVLQKTTTQLLVSAFAKYTLAEGDQLGTGPLPPTAGQATRYWIFFSAGTSYNDVKNLNYSAKLPTGVTPTGRTTATSEKPITLSSDKTEVAWQIDSLKAPSASYPQIGSGIEVEITPTTDQVGKIADLLTNIRVSATDVFTGEMLSLELPNITTAITDDKSGGIIK